MLELLGAAVQRFSSASAIGTLADGVVSSFRDMLGYDRVMVYKFDPDGHGKIIAEARDPRLESLLGHHYPASDIPQRARELYLRNAAARAGRRALRAVAAGAAPAARARRRAGHVDVLSAQHVAAAPAVPEEHGRDRDAGGVAGARRPAVGPDRLPPLLAAQPALRGARRRPTCWPRSISTRIAAIENYAHAQVAIQVRRLEQRLVEATSTEGDWRLALFRNPRTVLQPLEATGAALFHDGELLTAGETPSTAELRALMQWIDGQPFDGLFSCSSVARANADARFADAHRQRRAGGQAVDLAARLPDVVPQGAAADGDLGRRPVQADGRPTTRSNCRRAARSPPGRRSCAAPRCPGRTANSRWARAFGASLIDIIVQINAVRLLIAEHQLAQIRITVDSSVEPVVIGNANGQALFANKAFAAMSSRERNTPLDNLPTLFSQPQLIDKVLVSLRQERRPWRGELELLLPGGRVLPVAVRAEVVPARDGSVLGFFLIFVDLTDSQRASKARHDLEQSLYRAVEKAPTHDGNAIEQDDVIGAILSNASLAAMDIADGSGAPTVAPQLQEIEASTRRATLLYERIHLFDPTRRR